MAALEAAAAAGRRRTQALKTNQLATVALAIVVFTTLALARSQTLGHQQPMVAPAVRRHPPAIYSYWSAAAGTGGPASSWSNQRLGRVLVGDGDEPAAAAANDHQTPTAQHMSGELQEDFALLYSRPQVVAAPYGTKSAGGRRPAVGANRPRRPPPPSGTKTKAAGAGTKTRRPPAVAAAAPATPDFSPSHAAEANVTTTLRRGGGNQKRKNLVCYYGTWAVYRPDGGKFNVENIDPFLCTHVIYGFTGLSYDNMIKPLDPWNDLEDNYGKGAMKRFTNLKRANPDLKTIVAIGGWNEGSIKYSKMASDPEARAKFVASVLAFLERYNFDGLDLDWEYPGSRGGASYDKQNFVRLTRELHEAFAPRGYLLTAAVSAGKWFVDPAYDIPQVSRYLDLINLMAYDYHGGWETKTGMNAPLFGSRRHDLSRDDATLNVNWSVNYWLAQGAPREKLMLGVGSYGRSFTLDKGQVNGLNAPASQKGRAGPYTREPGSLGYNELCEELARSSSSNNNNNNNNKWTVVRDPDYLAPYAYNEAERQWVGYDDRESLALKAQYAKSMGLGGMMMWSIETDDFRGACHGGEKFPLLNTLRRVMDGDGGDSQVAPTGRPPSTTTRRPAVQTQRPPMSTSTTTVKPNGGHEVEEEEDSQRPAPASSTRRPPIFTTSTTSTTTRRPSRTTTTTRRPPARPTTAGTTQRPTQRPPTQPPQPQQPQQEFTCRAAGMFADPRNCRKFVRCVALGTGGEWQTFKFDCGPGTAFNEAQGLCDHIYNVPTCNSQQQQGRLQPPVVEGPAAAAAASSGGEEKTMIGWNQQQSSAGNNDNNNYLQPTGAVMVMPFMQHQQQHHLVLARQFYPPAPASFHHQRPHPHPHQFMVAPQHHHHHHLHPQPLSQWPVVLK